jgi:hypothetical protein
LRRSSCHQIPRRRECKPGLITSLAPTNVRHSGATLTIEASGIVKEDITEGAYVKLQVKYGYIKLLDTQADLCEEIKNVDLECPIEKGKISITKEVDLPKEIPPVRLPSSCASPKPHGC